MALTGAREQVGTVGRGSNPFPWCLLIYLPRRLDLGHFLSLSTWPRLSLAGDCPSLGRGSIVRAGGKCLSPKHSES